MGKDLIIGSAGLRGIERSMAAHLAGIGVNHDLDSWLTAEESIATICCLNGASVVEFLRHVIHVEGYSDERAGFAAGESGSSKFKNMPWWENSIWLPIEIEHVGVLEDDPTFFVGSCRALLTELHSLQRASPLQLGSIPQGYGEMRTDIRKFYQSAAAIKLDEINCTHWIWRALHDGAEIAISENTVLWTGPD